MIFLKMLVSNGHCPYFLFYSIQTYNCCPHPRRCNCVCAVFLVCFVNLPEAASLLPIWLLGRTSEAPSRCNRSQGGFCLVWNAYVCVCGARPRRCLCLCVNQGQTLVARLGRATTCLPASRRGDWPPGQWPPPPGEPELLPFVLQHLKSLQ